MSERSSHTSRSERTRRPHTRRRAATTIAVGLLAVTSLGMAACSSDDDSSADSDSTTTESTMADSGMDDSGMDDTTTMAPDSDMMAMEPSGPACAAVPADGAGSFTGMAEAPAATAASANPELSTLVAAVTEAGLVDTLNGEGPFTIFAPANSAFAKIPEADLNAVLADKAQLTEILTYHVVAGEKMSSEALVEAGTVETVQGGELTITDEGGTLTVNGMAAGACVDVPTANATVHIIDSVLMPSS